MPTDELKKLKADSAKWASKAKSDNVKFEECIHNANLALACLLIQSRKSDEQHSAFESWKTSRFSAFQFIDLVDECVQRHSEDNVWEYHVRYLVLMVLDWHHYSGLFFKEVKGDEHTCSYHFSQEIAIDFIYRTKDKLHASDSAKLDWCISLESPHCIRKLARKIVASSAYSWDVLKYFLTSTSTFHGEIISNDKIYLMACLFGEEVRLAWSKSDLTDPQYQAVFDVDLALYSRDANGIIKAYEPYISKAAADSTLGRQWYEALRSLWDYSLHKQNLEALTNRFDVSTSHEHTFQHQNVVEPVYLFLHSQFLHHKYNSELMEKLNDFGFHSYEEALKGKLELKRLNGDLYIRLLISEKCRDYAQHRDDLAYMTWKESTKKTMILPINM